MGEVVSLSQYRKERIREASRGSPADVNNRYRLAKLGQSDIKQSDIKDERVRQIVEFQSKEFDPPGDGPERL